MAEDSPADAATELGASITDTEAVTAWALDEGEEWEPPRRLTPWRITAGAVAASLVLIAVAGALAWQHFRGEETSAATPATTSLVPATMTSQAPPSRPPIPPPVTITTVVVQAPPTKVPEVAPPPPPVPVWNQALDNLLVDRLRSQGFTVWDPTALTGQAHNICMMLARGASSPQGVVNELSAPGSPTHANDARTFVTTIMATYPNCP